jgi:uncharacterized membrane protein (UPF0127 family)
MKTCMKIRWRNLLAALLLAGCVISSSCADTGVRPDAFQPALEPLSNFAQTRLSIVSADGRQHVLQVWLADTDAHRQQGLMMVKSLADDVGMLFVFDRPQNIQMWMKNTLIPLDMVFINASGRIDGIAVNATPLSLKIIESKTAVLGVLELAGGNAARLGLRVGAIVKYPAFASVGGSR